jgi:hypothetical protein
MKNQSTNQKIKLPLAKLFFLIIIIGFLSCDDGNGPQFPEVKTEARSEIEAITEFAAVKQAVTYDVLKTFSANYTKKLFERDDLTYQEIDFIFESFAGLNEYQSIVENSLSSLSYKSNLNKVGNIKAVNGLGDAMKGFFTWLSGSGKNSRNRILTVASNMNESERTKLYNSLRKDWKDKTSSESDFWQKLEKGDLDNQAPQIYNDFYHNDPDFGLNALDKDLKIQKIVHKEGAEGIEKGSKLIIEVVKTATPLGKGMDMVEKAEEYKNKMKDLYNDPTKAVKDEVKSAIANKIGNFVDIDGAVDAELISENLGTAIKFISDYTMGSEDPSEWVKKSIDLGLGKILDSDNTGSKADIVLAEKKNDDGKGPSVVISVDQKDDDFNIEDVIDIMVSAGEWIFSSFDQEGNSDKVEINIEEGIATIIVISTDSEGDHNKGTYALSVWASPADPAPDQGVTIYARVSPQTSGVQIYFSITGTDGYSDESNKMTDSNGLATYYIPGGDEDVRDIVTIRIVETGLTRTINYTF